MECQMQEVLGGPIWFELAIKSNIVCAIGASDPYEHIYKIYIIPIPNIESLMHLTPQRIVQSITQP